VSGIEDELRAMFAERAAAVPSVDDPARRTIREAARLRRRRETLAGLVGVVVMVLAGVGFGVVRGHGAPITTLVVPAASTYLATEPAITLDLRVGNQLWTADGRRLTLSGAGDVTWVYRVPAGWVYGGSGGMLRMIAPNGTAVRSWLPADAAAVSPDGHEVASVSGPNGSRTLVIGRLNGAGVEPVAATAVSDRAVPVGFVGPSVVLGRADAEGRISAYDFWDPSGNFRPAWNDQIVGVYGATGSRLMGLVSAAPGSTEGCVSYFDLDLRAGLRRAQLAGCGVGLGTGSARGSESPDGRWLVDQTEAGLVFVDLSTSTPATSTPATSTPAMPTPATSVPATSVPATSDPATSARPASGSTGPDPGASASIMSAPDTSDPGASGSTASGSIMSAPSASGAYCPVLGRSAPVWENDSAVLIATDDGLVRCDADGVDLPIQVSGLPAEDWDVVPAMGR
jgi:hypothetical protein